MTQTTSTIFHWSSHEPIWTDEEVQKYKGYLISDDWEIKDLGLVMMGSDPTPWNDESLFYPSYRKIAECLKILENNRRLKQPLYSCSSDFGEIRIA